MGSTPEAVAFFQNINLPCPYNYNPADHYIHVLAVTPGNKMESLETIHKVCDTFAKDDLGQKVGLTR